MKRFITTVVLVIIAITHCASLKAVTFLESQIAPFTIENKVMPSGVSYVWSWDSKYGAKASAYVSNENHEAESWLVSPDIWIEGDKATFNQAINFLNSGKREDYCNVYVREYQSNDWQLVEVPSWPAGNSWDFSNNCVIDLTPYKGKIINIGFQYKSTTSIAPTWEIKSLNVEGSLYGNFTYEGINYDVIDFKERTLKTRGGSSFREPGSSVSGNIILPETINYYGIDWKLIEIGDNSFPSNRGLTSVTIPNSVTSIGNDAFYNCSGLTSVTIPNSVTSIGNDAFSNCNNLRKSAYPDNISNPFHNGVAIAYPAEGSIIEDGFIYGPEKSEIFFAPLDLIGEFTIPNSVTSIGNSAFRDCSSLTSVSIPNSVTSIGNAVFGNCTGLRSVTIPESITSVDSSAFTGCPLFELSLEANTPPPFYASFDSFYDTTLLIIPDNTLLAYLSTGWSNFKNLKTEEGELVGIYNDNVFNYRFNDGTKEAVLVAGNYNAMTNASIPERVPINGSFYYVKGIGFEAFKNCSGLTSVSIPNSVTSIGNSVFRDCSSLTNVTIPNSVSSIGNSAFNGCSGLTKVMINDLTSWCNIQFGDYWSNPLSYANHLFLNGNEIQELIIPTSVTSIGDYTFYNCSGLTSVTIPNSVTSIGNGAFAGCSGLTSVEISNSVTSIGNGAFTGCSGLISVTIPNSVTSIGNGAFGNCTGLTSVIIPNSVTSIEEDTFYNCSGLTSVTIGNSVTSIGSSAFSHCSGLTNITIPNSVTSIGSSAFNGCSGLTSVTIGNSVTSVGDRAFLNCSGLTSVTIGNSVTSVGEWAFLNCSGLTSVTIPNSVTTIGNAAFYGCYNVKNLIFEDGVEVLSLGNDFIYSTENLSLNYSYIGRSLSGYYPYSYAKNTLTSVEIGPFVESIGDEYFKNFTALKSVKFLSEVPFSIGASAFQGCEALKSAEFSGSVAEIGDRAFYGTALTDIVVPNANIGTEAFASLNLKHIVLGANVESIGEKAFDGSNSLTGVYATALVPPLANANTFSSYDSPLYVLEQRIDDYYNDINCWYRFKDYALVEPEIIELAKGQITTNTKGEKQLQLSATVSPANTTLQNILWSSSDPTVATVDNNGLVTFHVNDMSVQQNSKAKAIQKECEITATTLYPDSPIATVKITGTVTGIDVVVVDGNDSGKYEGVRPNDVYNLQGVMLKRNASQEDIDALEPGLYIIGGKKVLVK